MTDPRAILEGGTGDLEVSADGQVAVMVAGEPAWHRLGPNVSEAQHAADALRIAHLDNWNIHKVPFFGQRGDRGGMAGRTIEFPGMYGTVRTNPFTGELEGLGVVGKVWKPFQNEDMCDTLDAIVDESGAHYHTAGSLDGGRKVFVSMKLPEGILVGGEDPIDLYLVAATDHAGNGSNEFFVSPVRPVCRNTLKAGRGAAVSKWSFRHSGKAEGRVQEARETLKIAWKVAHQSGEVYDAMLADPFSNDEMDALLHELIPDPKSEKPGWVARAAGSRGAVMNLFRNADTCEFGRGTKWAAYNAITEYADWWRPGSNERKAREALGLGVNTELKTKAFKALAPTR